MEQYLKLVIEQLEKLDVKLDKMSVNRKKYEDYISIQKENMINHYHQYNKYYAAFVKESKLNTDTLNKSTDKINDLLEKLPVKHHKTFHFNKESRNQVLITIIGLAFIMVMSIGAVRHFKDNTDYKKAWNYILEQDLSIEQRGRMNTILENAKKTTF